MLFGVMRQNLGVVDVEGFLLVAGHEVDVELGDAYFAEAVELLAVLVDGADEAEAVDDLVADEIGVVAANFAVVEIVVLATVFYERGEGWGKLLGLVLGDEVHHVIGDERGKPADVFASGFQIVGGPDGSGGHYFAFAKVAVGVSGALAGEAQAPVDQIGIGELQNDAVADAPGSAQSFGAVAGHPDAGNVAAGPWKFRGDAIEIDGLACVQVAEDADEFLKVFESGGFLAEDAAGTVAAAPAELHSALRSQIYRCQAGCGGRYARDRRGWWAS